MLNYRFDNLSLFISANRKKHVHTGKKNGRSHFSTYLTLLCYIFLPTCKISNTYKFITIFLCKIECFHKNYCEELQRRKLLSNKILWKHRNSMWIYLQWKRAKYSLVSITIRAFLVNFKVPKWKECHQKGTFSSHPTCNDLS